MLRADDVDNARATAALFTREEAGEPEQHLRDMQASWYELEVGSALARRVTSGSPAELRELAGPALKLFLSVEKHFSDFVEDQFDFHTYCVRKMTLRAYVSVLKLEDGIRGHKAFVKACCQAAELYLLLHKADSAEVAKPQEAVDPKVAKALAKREKAKAAKAKRKAEADAKAAEAAAKNDEGKKKLPKRDADEDPKGEKLADGMVAARHFNTVQLQGDYVVKTSARSVLRGEMFFYSHMPPDISDLFPQLKSSSDDPPKPGDRPRAMSSMVLQEDGSFTNSSPGPGSPASRRRAEQIASMTLQRVHGVTFSHLVTNRCLTAGRLVTFLTALHRLHSSVGDPPSQIAKPEIDVCQNYLPKLRRRFA